VTDGRLDIGCLVIGDYLDVGIWLLDFLGIYEGR
jgi:hypothetical protein